MKDPVEIDTDEHYDRLDAMDIERAALEATITDEEIDNLYLDYNENAPANFLEHLEMDLVQDELELGRIMAQHLKQFMTEFKWSELMDELVGDRKEWL